MKTAQQLEKALPGKFAKILESDKRDIDNPDPYHRARLNYWDRTQKILDIFAARFPDPAGSAVADIGCAQGNLSLLLAERGFRVTALELNPVFLEYARSKQEQGDIRWLEGNFDGFDLPGRFDAVVLGQIIEHCAYPEDLILKTLRWLKPAGWLLLTTPNACMFRNHQPTFGRLRRREDRKKLEERQFGPDGRDHLFLFTRSDLKLILPANARLEESGYLGGTVLINRRTEFLLRCFPASWVRRLERLIARTPLINRLTCHDLYAVVSRKP